MGTVMSGGQEHQVMGMSMTKLVELGNKIARWLDVGGGDGGPELVQRMLLKFEMNGVRVWLSTREPDEVHAYCQRALIRVGFDWIRANNRECDFLRNYATEALGIEAQSSDGFDSSRMHERAARIMLVVTDGNQRETLRMYLCGMSMKEIAIAQGKHYGAVKKVFQRIYKKVREQLGKLLEEAVA